MGIMQEFESSSTLFGSNAPFIEELYEHYLASPDSVPAEWREYFDELRDGAQDVAHAPVVESFRELARSRKVAHAMVDAGTMHKQVLVLQLIGKFRVLGLYQADLDPLKRTPPPYIPDLDLKTYGFSEADLDTEFDAGSFKAGGQRMKLRDIIDALRETYCRTFGAEYMDIADTTTKRWVQGKIEPIRARPSYDAARKRDILERLTAAETLERYLHTKYVGQKRFSLEGSETMIPMLDHLIQLAGAYGVNETVIGMAHRGRLNVLVNTLGKMPSDLFSEFEGKHASRPVGGRRQVPPGLLVGRHNARRADAPDARVQPVAPRGGEPGRRRQRARAPASARRHPRRPGAAGAAAWRRSDRGAGGRAGMPEHGCHARLLHRRHGPHRHQQPDRLHDVRPARHAGYAVLHRHREDGRRADLPRERRRSRGLHARDRARDGIPPAVPQGRVHRPRVLPPARPQRGRRADGHAAADVQEDRRASRHAQALRRSARERGRDPGGRGGSEDRRVPGRDGQGPSHEQDDPVELQASVRDRLGAVHGPALDDAVRSEACRSNA